MIAPVATPEYCIEITQQIRDLEKRIRIQETWSAEHDGRINALWSEQREFNRETTLVIKKCTERLVTMEKRLIWMVGFGSGIGAVLGAFGASLIRLAIN